jgi:uracil-DNA glycosylase
MDRPKSLADVVERERRRQLLSGPHMAPLTAFLAALRSEIGSEVTIPDFDPLDGGTAAEVLYLLEAPGAKAVASGFISRNNPDQTARNFFELNVEAGIPRERTITWNIVPWYIGSGTKIRPASRSDINSGLSVLRRLLDLLPNLRAVVLVGDKAQKAEAAIAESRPNLRIFRSPHPSPLFVNNAPGNRARILNVLREVARYLETAPKGANPSPSGM